jgi:hypothetical protein
MEEIKPNKPSNTPLPCPLCGLPDTQYHIFMECTHPNMRTTTAQILQDLEKTTKEIIRIVLLVKPSIFFSAVPFLDFCKNDMCHHEFISRENLFLFVACNKIAITILEI